MPPRSKRRSAAAWTRSRCPSRALPRPSSTAGRRESFADRRARRAAIDDPAVVLDAALRFLEVRPRSVTEVRRRLGLAGYQDDLVEAALDRLGKLGVLDDEAFARQWVESRDRARPRGERALQVELRQKGIDSETIARTLDARRDAVERGEEGESSPDEAGARRRLDRSAAALARVVDPRARRHKAYALLARSGFSSELASRLAREFTDGESGESGESGEY